MDNDATHVFEAQLLAETLHSERLRALAMALTLVLLGTIFFSAQVIGGSPFLDMLRQSTARYWTLALTGGLALYEVWVYVMLGRWLRRQQRCPRLLHYWNALLETSLPSLSMIVFARSLEPVYTLISLAPYVYFLCIILSALRLEFWLCVFTGAVAALEYIALAHWYTTTAVQPPLYPMLSSSAYFILKGVVLLMAGLCAGFVTLQIRQRLVKALHVTEEHHQVLRLFGQHVSPAVVRELLHNQHDTGTARKHVCIMFTDIRGFTTFAEQRTPEETVAYLNAMFAFMIQIINDHHGIVHQLLGDGLMAIFGAPVSFGNDSENAVQAATAILACLQQEIDAGRIPPTRLGIGLHAGEVLAGPIGSSLHKEYKVTGDVVNLASRIEQLNKEFNSQLLISGAVLTALSNRDQATPLGPVLVRGRAEPVEVYALAP
ncbi:MAG: adenylate/guanylate cyclase domain-containing protein [Candidatus Tectimicrobiota bacterium]